MQSTATTREDLKAELDALTRVQAVIWFEPDGTIVSANENFCKAVGYREEDIVGKHHRIFVKPDYAVSEAYQNFWPTLAKGEVRSGEFERVANGGKTVFLEACYSPLTDESGTVKRVVKTAFNITDRKQKQERLIASVSEAANVIAKEVEAITRKSNELSKRSENQAATVEETSAAMEQISQTVKSNVKNAEQATEEARTAKQEADKGSEVVEKAIAAMKTIEDGSKEIRKFIEVIDSIAFQTNLLALNAGVEAARAGDAGRGFAVVASEVRALAQRASESAKDINALIDSSTREVDEGARLVNETGAVLNEITQAVNKVTDGIENIFTASQEQASGVLEINQSISHIDKNTQSNATMSQESAESAANLAKSAAELLEMVDQFGYEGAVKSAEAVAPAWASAGQRQASVTPIAQPRMASTGTNTALSVAPSYADEDDAWTEF